MVELEVAIQRIKERKCPKCGAEKVSDLISVHDVRLGHIVICKSHMEKT